MSKRNTVRINMDLLDGYLTAKNITPKEFCETRLGFSDGWYYGIRKKGGRGVKVLVAQLIARIIGVEYETLVVEDGNGNPSVTKGDSSLYTREPVKTVEVSLMDFAEKGYSFAVGTAGASPRPTERAEGDAKKDPFSDWLESVHESIEADKRKNKVAGLFQKIDALKMDNILLKKDLEEKEKALAVAFEQIEAFGRKAEEEAICVSYKDTVEKILEFVRDSLELKYEHLEGYLCAISALIDKSNKRKETEKNARPEED